MFDREVFKSAGDEFTSFACGCIVFLVLFVGGAVWGLWWLWHHFT